MATAAFLHAVETARASIPIQKAVTRPEYWCGYVIVRRPGRDDSYAAYTESAWRAPKETPLLPWTPPQGVRVALVSLEGVLTMLGTPT